MDKSSKIIGVDLAKNVFQLALANKHYHVTRSKRLNRTQFYRFFVNHPPVQVVMESCGTAHYWARTLKAMGHQVTLLPAQHVRPYVRRNKTDRSDAMAIVEAARNPEIKPVPVKTEYQQSLQSLHRLREQWKATRVARINALRGILREFGVLVPMGPRAAISTAGEVLPSLPALLQSSVQVVLEELSDIETRIRELEKQLKQAARDDVVIQQFMHIQGIGLLCATAMRASVQSPAQFKNGRQLSAWLGITPREFSSGDHRYLGRISKRGDKYLRTLLIHGARSVMARIKRLQHDNRPLSALQLWAAQLEQRVGHNKATVALANKLVRILWATWMHQREFDANYTVQ
ncbi:IS110 family transposase [Sulfuriflexus mobilis]|uniref:IS110 family transposase n=1 Tax=Sulfuriflexus mobilis TaxID=1811807 RepID=UPI000F822631|nr:IS110 family transposase [Sulfuriflexus mobilis]